jgi:ClpP class serine protease
LVSYQGLVRNIDTLVSRKDEVSLLAVFIDSPGGEAFRAFEAGRSVKEKLTKAGIRSVAYVDGIAASGGYVLASAFDEIVANPDSEVGSIGVRVALRNPSQEEKDRVLYVTAGENKVPFDAEGNFTESFINKIQTGINETYDTFVTYVADMRGMTREAVIDTKADTFSAKRSLGMGLIDKVMTGDEFVNYIADLKDSSTKSGNLLTVSADTDSRIEDDSVAEDSIEIESNENLNVEELSSDDTSIEENGDIMSDKELNDAQVAELELAEMKAQIEAQTAQLQELMAEKEAAAKEAAEELARKEEELAAKDLATIEEFVSGISFVGAEDEAKELVDALFVNRKIEGMDAVMATLGKAQAAVDAAATQISVESPSDSEEVSEEAQDKQNLMKAIEAVKASRK